MAVESHVAVLGAGVIGSSWTALMLAAGHDVAIHDPDAKAESTTREYIERAWPTLRDLGLVTSTAPGDLRFCGDPVEAVEGAAFIQENVPERIRIKHELYSKIEAALPADTIVATSASGLQLRELQAGWRNPARFVLGHPFNPPHLIPLVEVMGNERTAPGVPEAAEKFYQSLGKVTIRVKREVPGHVANRLQAALWREAIHLMNIGAASLEDIDTAVWAGPGLRWAAMGPSMLFHLGAGPGGLAEFCERYSGSFERWWADLGDVRFDQETTAKLLAGIEAEAGQESLKSLCERRDALIKAFLKAGNSVRTA
jgi:carnitine 3-dehydrogenase